MGCPFKLESSSGAIGTSSHLYFCEVGRMQTTVSSMVGQSVALGIIMSRHSIGAKPKKNKLPI